MTTVKTSVLKSATQTYFLQKWDSLIQVNDMVEISRVRFDFVLAFKKKTKQTQNPQTLKFQDRQKPPKRVLFNL